MKKFILAAAVFPLFAFAAYAADPPNTKDPPTFAPPPPPAFSWTGFYIGGQVGYEWGRSDPYLVTDPGDVFVLALPGYDDEGVVGGGHAGYNWQVQQFVLGIEGDIEGSSYSGSGSFELAAPYRDTLTTRIPLQGSIRGRVGWTWDRLLIYGTGGAAFASIRNTSIFVDSTSGAVLGYDSATNGRVGWTVGGGIEYAIDPNWSIRAEYRYTDYGSYDFPLPNTFAGAAAHEHERDNRAEAGFSYKFDAFAPPGPAMQRY